MRILQIVHGFPPEAIAGTETYCEALSRGLLTRGHECLVLAGSERGAPEATLSTVEQDGLLVTRYLMAERRSHRWMEEYDPEAEGLARHLLALVNPEVVHLHHWLHLTNNLVAICSELGLPVVVTLHDVWTSCPRVHRIRSDGVFYSEPAVAAPCLTCVKRAPWDSDREIAGTLSLRREMMETELALADSILVPSGAHRALLLSLFDLPQERLVVLPHGSIRTVAPNEGRQGRLTFPNRPLQIGNWDYLMYEKGTHLILDAVHRLRDPSAVQLHLIGTADERAYEQRLQNLAQGMPVQFHGPYRPDDLNGFDLDLAVFASIASESYSFALDEALCLGLPVLVPDRAWRPFGADRGSRTDLPSRGRRKYGPTAPGTPRCATGVGHDAPGRPTRCVLFNGGPCRHTGKDLRRCRSHEQAGERAHRTCHALSQVDRVRQTAALGARDRSGEVAGAA